MYILNYLNSKFLVEEIDLKKIVIVFLNVLCILSTKGTANAIAKVRTQKLFGSSARAPRSVFREYSKCLLLMKTHV